MQQFEFVAAWLYHAAMTFAPLSQYMLPAACEQFHQETDIFLCGCEAFTQPHAVPPSHVRPVTMKTTVQRIHARRWCYGVLQEDGSYAFFNNMGHAKLPLHGVAAIGDTVARERS